MYTQLIKNLIPSMWIGLIIAILLDEMFNITIGNTRLIIKEANNNGR